MTIPHNAQCKMAGCDKPHYGFGFCRRHCEWFRTGRIDLDGNILIPVRQKGGRRCKVEGCDRKYNGAGFCEYHRTQFRRKIIDSDGKMIRELKSGKALEKCKIEGCNGLDDGKGFCSKHRSWLKKGIMDVDGKRLRRLYYEMKFDRRNTHKKSEDFVMDRYFDGGPLCHCPICGGDFEFYQIDGHHPDRSKKTMTPTTMLARAVWRKPEMLAELDSLQWMCCHCHLITEAGGEDVLYGKTNTSKTGKMKDKVINLIFDKRGKKCADCHRILGRRTVVFHHREPLQKAAVVSQIIGVRRTDFVLSEVDKCDLLCAPCHRKRHYQDKNLVGNAETTKALLAAIPIERHIRSNGRCLVKGCDNKHQSKGFCNKHRHQFLAGVIDKNGIVLRPLYLATKRRRAA